MTNQTILNILLSIATVYLAVRNYMMAAKKEDQRESQEMTEIKVRLNQLADMMRDMQKDIRTSTADFRELTGRVIKIETRLDQAISRLEKLEENHGK